MAYSVNKIKTFRGREGGGFNAHLLRDGVAVAFVMDDASGGPVDYHWVDVKAKSVIGKFRSYDDTIGDMRMTPEQAAFEAHVIEQPGYMYHGKMSCMTADVYLERLITMAKVEDRVRKMFKGTHVVMVLDGKIATIKLRAGDHVMDALPRIKPKYPTAQFLNELPLEKAMAIAVPLISPED